MFGDLSPKVSRIINFARDYIQGILSVINGGTGTKTAPSSAQILVAQGSTLYSPVTVSGDAAISTSGAVTLAQPLHALVGYNANGLVCQTSQNTFAAATITGTSNQIAVTGGAGTAPTIAFVTSPVMPSGTTATTQSLGDNSTKLATTAYVNAALFPPAFTNNSKSSSFSAAIGNSYEVTASSTCTLPTAVGVAGQVILVINAGSSVTITFDTTSSQTMNTIASGSLTSTVEGDAYWFVSDGSNWWF